MIEIKNKMTLDELNKLSDEIIINFINKLGYDGKEYIKLSGGTYICLVDEIINGVGEYVSPYFYEANMNENMMIDVEDQIEEIKQDNVLTKEQEESIKEHGYIKLIKKDFYDSEDLKTLIHEKIHSFRNMTIFNFKNSSYYFIDKDGTTNTKQFQIDNEKNELFSINDDLDFSVLKGNYDNKYNNVISLLLEQNPNMSITDLKKYSRYIINKKLAYSINVNETLVELITLASYKIYKNPNMSIIDFIKHISEINTDEDMDLEGIRMIYMCRIILSHNNLDLFKWVLSPLEHINDVIQYDYFNEYTKNDPVEYLEIFEKKIEELNLYDYDIMDYFIKMENKKNGENRKRI